MEADLTIPLYQKLGLFNYLADTYYIKGAIQNFTGNPSAAIKSFEKCRELSELTQYYDGIGKTLKGLGDIYESEGNYEAAYEYQVLLKTTQNSLFNEDRNKKLPKCKLKLKQRKKKIRSLSKKTIFLTSLPKKQRWKDKETY